MASMFQRHPKVEGAPLNDETILLDPDSAKFFMLNRTCAFIWERLSKPATAESLARELCMSFDNVTHDDALNDVRATLKEMLSLELVVTIATA
jgi:hypothetical protein